MIRKLLATTAIATLVAGGAIAQEAPAPASSDPLAAPDAQQTQMEVRAEGFLASVLIGETVYNGTGEEAENIGKVTDLVITPEGDVEALVVGVGGFLGIGQKEVALEYDVAEWSELQDGERWLVIETSRDSLEALPEFDRSAYRPMPADAEVSEAKPATKDDLAKATAEGEDAEAMPADETAQAPAEEEADMTAEAPAEEEADVTAEAPADEEAGTEAGAAQDMAATEQREEQPAEQETAQADQTQDEGAETSDTVTGAIDPGQMQRAGPDQIRTENLTGTAVYGANDEHVGEIGDVILTPEGEVDAIIVDVGGFLGIGEKEVSIGMENLAFMTDENGELYLFTDFTQEELEAAPEFDEATYAEQRDTMRLRMQ